MVPMCIKHHMKEAVHTVRAHDSGNMKDDLLKFDEGRHSGKVSAKYLVNLKRGKAIENWKSMMHGNVKVWYI